MSVIFLLIGFSLLVAIGFLIAFIWSIRSGQFEDEYTPSVRILFDDEIVDPDSKEKKEDKKEQKKATGEEPAKDGREEENQPKT